MNNGNSNLNVFFFYLIKNGIVSFNVPSHSRKKQGKNPEESPAGHQMPRGSAQDSRDGTKCHPTASRHVILCHSMYLNLSWKNDKMKTKKNKVFKKIVN